jgi:hypothetical protein
VARSRVVGAAEAALLSPVHEHRHSVSPKEKQKIAGDQDRDCLVQRITFCAGWQYERSNGATLPEEGKEWRNRRDNAKSQ